MASVSAPDDREGPVVPREPQRPTDRRIDEPGARTRRGQGGSDRFEQQRADLRLLPRRRVEAHELRIGPEAAAGGVDRTELTLDRAPRVDDQGKVIAHPSARDSLKAHPAVAGLAADPKKKGGPGHVPRS